MNAVNTDGNTLICFIVIALGHGNETFTIKSFIKSKITVFKYKNQGKALLRDVFA